MTYTQRFFNISIIAIMALALGLSPLTPTAQAAEDVTSLVQQSHKYVNLKPNAGFTFILTYKNIGTTTWAKENVYLKGTTTALKFSHSYWPDPYHPAQLQEESVAPGGTGTFKFALTAPPNFGEYTGDFLLVNDNMMIAGGQASVTLNVVADPSAVVVKAPEPIAPVVVTQPSTESPIPSAAVAPTMCTLNFRTASTEVANSLDGSESTTPQTCVEKFQHPPEGPLMRVGIYHTEDFITLKNTKPWEVQNSNGTVLYSVPADVEVSFIYDAASGEYAFDAGSQTIRTTSYLSLKNPNAGMFTITSYHNKPSYSTKIDYNDFIGDFEIRHNTSYDRTWVINILPMETYLEGIQETTNYDPIEYLKTMSVAARTYAAYHYDRASKHAKEFFLVDATYDQVYKGYVSMQLFPRIGEAVRATRGIVATYDDKVIVAPYFSRGDGRTRSFAEVWGSEVPYLQSVETPYTADKTLYGHGVGIDAYDALKRAKNDGWTFDQLLKYYYTGIDLEQLY